MPLNCRRCGGITPTAKYWYCDRCRPRRNRGPSAAEAGYGREHQRLRRRLKVVMDATGAACVRCGQWIAPGEPWDLGHDDFDRSVYRGPEHRRCNRATAGRRLIVREW